MEVYQQVSIIKVKLVVGVGMTKRVYIEFKENSLENHSPEQANLVLDLILFSADLDLNISNSDLWGDFGWHCSFEPRENIKIDVYIARYSDNTNWELTIEAKWLSFQLFSFFSKDKSKLPKTLKNISKALFLSTIESLKLKTIQVYSDFDFTRRDSFDSLTW